MGYNKLLEGENKSIPNKVIDKLGNIVENAIDQFRGTVSLTPIAQYSSAARVKLRVNGNLIGFAFGISWNITTSVNEVRTVDNYLPHELTPQHMVITGTLSHLHIPGEGPSALSHQAHILNFLQQKYITIEVRDTQSDNLLFFTNRAMVTSRKEDINAEKLSTITLEWRAVSWKDEKEPERPKDWIDGVNVRGDVAGSNILDGALKKARDIFSGTGINVKNGGPFKRIEDAGNATKEGTAIA